MLSPVKKYCNTSIFFLTQAYLERLLCIMSSYLDYYNFTLSQSLSPASSLFSAAKCLTKSERQVHIISILATRYELSPCIHSSGHTHLSDPTGLSSWWDYTFFKHLFPLMKQLLLISHYKRCEREWKMNLWLCVCFEYEFYWVKWHVKYYYTR